MASQSISPGLICEAALWPRSEQPSAGRTPNPRSVKFRPLRAVLPTPSSATHFTCDWSTPPWRIKSSSSRPTGLSTNAVTIAVSRPKQRRKPRATLYSPPPSQTEKERAVQILFSPGSNRSITSPRLTRSQRHSCFGRMFIAMRISLLPVTRRKFYREAAPRHTFRNYEGVKFDCGLSSGETPSPWRPSLTLRLCDGAAHAALEIAAKEPRDVALDFVPGGSAAIVEEPLVKIGEDAAQNEARAAPFVNHLFENARIGMLRNEAHAQHFDALPRYLLNDRWIIEEPPAAEGHQVAELASVDAQLMLILAAKDADEEAVLGKIAAEAFDRDHVGFPHGITGKPNAGIHLAAHAYHQGQGQTKFSAGRKHRIAQKAGGKRLLWILKLVG